METPRARNRWIGITFRTAILSWLVTLFTLVIFVTAIIPEQKRTLFENLESKAHGTTVSLRDVAAGAVVNEDYSTVVDYCVQMLNGDPTLDYLVITRNEGFSMIHDRTGWRSEPETPAEWRPVKREIMKGIGADPLFQRRVFHYSTPFDYSGIQWGWIHVGLSLEGYDRSVAAVYQRTGMLAVLCIIIGLLASAFYAKRLVKPILNLQAVVQDVAGGDLSSRAVIKSGDEIGSLAGSINSMAEALLQRDRILRSVRFAAQQFLANTNWEGVIEGVLAMIGQAAGVSRVHVFETQRDTEGKRVAHMRFEWVSEGIAATIESPVRRTFARHESCFEEWAQTFERKEILKGHVNELGELQRLMFEPYGVKSFLGIPIVAANAWWGIFGLEECQRERRWTDAELDSLQAAADMLGAAIERRGTQDALMKAKEAAESASQAKSQFLANMSHEIRTPITGVIGMLQLLHRMNLDRKTGRYVANALTSAEALMDVIGDVLDFSKIEAGKMDLEENVFRLSEIVDSAVRMFAERAERKGIELAYQLGDSLPEELIGDQNRLRQVLVNLLGNAVKFTDKGEIIVNCHRQEISKKMTTLRFEVRDSGCGIGREQQALVFDAFSQADNSMSRAHGGTGLGLAISRQLCEMMGGAIGVESELGRGSTFWFTVQLKEPGCKSSRSPIQLLDLKGMRVLVVEDCVPTRNIFREYIQSWKGLVDVAPNAAVGLDKLRSAAKSGAPFKVAVVDWRMPGMDGVTMARVIKGDAVLRETGLVLLSSFAQVFESDDLKGAGFAASVPKPLSRSDLYDAIVTAANDDLKTVWDASRKTTGSHGPSQCVGSKTILLVEDNEISREVVSEILTELGYRCREARTGLEAVEAVRKGNVDLVLMDCQMPEMDGYEATRVIRRRERVSPEECAGRRVPIVALTAHAAKSDRERCLAAGMDGYLSKPIDPGELAGMLKKWLDGNGRSPRCETGSPGEEKTTGEQAAVIDYPSLMETCMGRRELAEKLIRMFLDNTGDSLQTLESALQLSDAQTIAATAHSLKGAAGTVSAMAMWDLSARLETMGRENDLAQAPELVHQLWDQLRILKSSVENSDHEKGEGPDSRCLG